MKRSRYKMRELGGRWRDSNLEELLDKNKSIHRDFLDYMDHISLVRRSVAQA